MEVLHLAPIPLPDEYVNAAQLKKPQPVFPLDLDLCGDCGNVQLQEIVDPKIIYRNYIYETVSSLGLIKHFQKYASDLLIRICPPNETLVIDVGSNDGTLLAAFKKQHMRVLGIDPAVQIAQAATDTGIETLPEFFVPSLAKKIVKKYGKAHIVTINNLFANVDDLDAFMAGITELLDSDGVLVIESFYLPDLIKNMVFDFIYHEHLSYFTVTSLQSFFARHSMQLIDVLPVPTKGGSLRYTVQKAEGMRKEFPNVKKFIAYEKKMGVHTASLFTKFQKRISRAKQNLTNSLIRFHKQGKIIAGYGASATSTTLIYHFDLADKLDFLIDDYSRKQNTFSPGVHIPVFSPDVIKKRKPEIIVILAWRYIDPIVEKNKDFLSRGGLFIVPLPKLKIISKHQR